VIDLVGPEQHAGELDRRRRTEHAEDGAAADPHARIQVRPIAEVHALDRAFLEPGRVGAEPHLRLTAP
jgi:hypothetical protein